MTNSSIFTKVLALVLCLVMVLGTFTACFGSNDVDGEIDTEIKDVVDNETNNGEGDVEGGNENVDNGNTEEKDPNEIFSASAEIGQDSLIYGALANGVLIGDHESYSAIIPADVKVEAGAQSLALSIKSVEEADESFADYNVAQSLDVHVAGIAADNTVPMIVNLGAVLEAGLGETELKLYHMENGTAVLMTRVDSVNDFAIHNQYYYNAETGEVSIYVASFSVFVAVEAEASVWEDDTEADTSWYVGHENDTEFTLDNVAEFLGFRDLVDAGNTFEGKTVTLTVDINLNGKLFDPIGFGYYKDEKNTDEGDTNTVFLGTFDGGNHTIYNLYQNCWELDPDKTNYGTYTYSTAGAGLFASIKNATIKNVAISGAEVVFECVDMGVLVGYAQGECHFENIIITSANIANYNRYTGGLVGEVSYGVDNNGDGYSHTFKNITIDSSVTVSGLWGSFGCGMGGVIGGKWGDATVLMENVVSAPVMDVYNDVVSAYQWYAFRGCGMLIGHTEEPYSDGRHSGNATASFLTCKDVNVYYGDWVEYNYYQFANQTDAEGNTLWYSNYPWVRAEEGNYCDAFSNIRYGIPLINGVKVTELSEEEFNAAVTDYTIITFDQLYGADRGMYGTNKHPGVNVSYSSPKTYYINNNLGWTNLKLTYTYNHGEETWTTVPDGIELFESNGVYRIDLPVGAISFTITADGGFEVEFTVADLTEKGTYPLHTHDFGEGTCSCGATQTETWELATDVSQINVGDVIVFVYEDGTVKYEMSSIESNIGKYTAYTEVPTGLMTFEVVTGNNGLAFKNGSDYLAAINDNKVSTSTSIAEDSSWTISITDEKAIVTNVSFTERVLQFNANSGSERFCCYKGTQKSISIYVKTSKISCVECVMEVVDHKDASCGVAGYTVERCSVCGNETRTEHEALTHDYTGANPYICLNNCGTYNLPEAGSEITIQQALWIAETLENGKETSNKYVITGVIDDKDHPSSTGATTITDDGYSIYITNIHNADGTIRHDAFTVALKDGNTITVSAKIAKNDSGEVQLHDTWLANHTDADPADHTCDICGATEITDHVDENSDEFCDICSNAIEGGETPDPETPANNRYYIAAIRASGNYYYMTSDLGTASTKRYTAVDSGLTTLPTSITAPENGYVFILIDNGDDTYSIQAEGVEGNNNYLGWTSGNSGTLVAEGSAINFTLETNNGVYNIHFAASDAERYLALNENSGNDYFAWYKSGQKQDLTLIPVEGGDNGGETPACTHENQTTTTVDATCTEAGSVTVTCVDCDAVISTEVIPVIDHNYVDGACSACGEADPNAGGSGEPVVPVEATLTFDNTSKRTEYSTSKQVWTENGVTLTNNKSSSTTNVADYSKPARFYANSEIVVEVEGEITKIVFDCNSSSYATALKNSIGTVSGATVTVSSDKVTVEFSSAVEIFTITKLSGQVRMDAITVTYTPAN